MNFQRCTGVDVSDVCIVENPDLEMQGKRGVAIEGRCVEVAPGLLSDQKLCRHELIHIAQQRGVARGLETPEASVEQLEAEACAGAQALAKGQAFEIKLWSSQPRLYSDTSDEQHNPMTAPNMSRSKGTLSHMGDAIHEARREELEKELKVLDTTYDSVPLLSELVSDQAALEALHAFRQEHPKDDLQIVTSYLNLIAPHVTHHDETHHRAGTIGTNVEGGRMLYVGGCAHMSRLIARDLDQLFGIVCDIKSESVSYQLVLERYRSRGIGGHDYIVFRNRANGKRYGMTHADDIYNTHFKAHHDAGHALLIEESQIQRYWASYVNEYNKARIAEIDLMLSHESARSEGEQGVSLHQIDVWAKAREPVRFPFLDEGSRTFILDDVSVTSIIDNVLDAALLSVFEERGIEGLNYFFHPKNIDRYFFTQNARVPHKVLGNVLEQSDHFYHWKVSPNQVNRRTLDEPHPLGEAYLAELATRYPRAGEVEKAVDVMAHLFVLEMAGLRVDGNAVQEHAIEIAQGHEARH